MNSLKMNNEPMISLDSHQNSRLNIGTHVNVLLLTFLLSFLLTFLLANFHLADKFLGTYPSMNEYKTLKSSIK